MVVAKKKQERVVDDAYRECSTGHLTIEKRTTGKSENTNGRAPDMMGTVTYKRALSVSTEDGSAGTDEEVYRRGTMGCSSGRLHGVPVK